MKLAKTCASGKQQLKCVMMVAIYVFFYFVYNYRLPYEMVIQLPVLWHMNVQKED